MKVKIWSVGNYITIQFIDFSKVSKIRDRGNIFTSSNGVEFHSSATPEWPSRNFIYLPGSNKLRDNKPIFRQLRMDEVEKELEKLNKAFEELMEYLENNLPQIIENPF